MLLLAYAKLYAQISYEKRIEIEEQDGYKNYQSYQFGEEGIVISYERDLKSGDLAEYYFDFYDKPKLINRRFGKPNDLI